MIEGELDPRAVRTNEACVFVPRLTPRQRLLTWLFPPKNQPAPEDCEGFAPGYARTMTYVNLDWGDRLRLLVSGQLRVDHVHQTDVVIGRMRTQAQECVLPPGVHR